VSGELTGVTVVVTRPAHQAAPFAALLTAQGAHVVGFPSLAIEPLPLDAPARERLAPDRYDWVIYTSANAVRAAQRALPAPVHGRVLAIGPATAATLAEVGVEVAAVATHAASEGLLALPALADIRGREVLIIRGRGGRELLHNELTRRGARVQVAELYRRVPAVATQAALLALARALAADPAVVSAGSGESLAALRGLVPEPLTAMLRQATLLLPGRRIAAIARTHGFVGPVIEAVSADDAGMLAALLAHFRSRGPRRGA
jgi:uroporphyrinogen-III synthase